MAQFETTGGGFIDGGDRQVERVVVVSTEGEPITIPSSSLSFPLTNASITQEAGGILRGVFEFSRAGEGGASYNQFGKRIELTGGTREAPIQTHPAFADLTETQLAEVDTAIENKVADQWKTFSNEYQQLLYNFLRKKVEYVLVPSVVGRITEVESNLPNLSGIAKVDNPTELNTPYPKPDGTFWINTAITATPIGDRFEVTREYTLNYSEWEDVNLLYNYQ